ncbi:autotransporter-associated beta strand repeat-containing protein [Roseibacillus persicicus]|uniref:Uncharacterized protein n=1 Tax=Roseibacillus persicicus TaxID=454148 RepID=A0A918TBU7_9BACT|nr:autotransporter-associated beta strand repeat-containing protein [Roseibacillus persicicus]GHC41025.1 hypothetical protein GCM10007100_02050 [Roseibacillus persicicus]
MKPTGTSRFLLLATSSVVFSSSLPGEVTFEFPNGNHFDSAGIGANATLLDPVTNSNAILTTVDIKGQDGSLASSGDPDTNHLTNSTGNNALGVNSNLNPGGYSNQSRDFNPGEAWTFSFNVEVKLEELDFAGWTGPAEITLSSSAFTNIVFNDDGTAEGTLDLGSTVVPPNTPITMEMTSDDTEGNDTGVRLSYLKVSASAPPSDGANLTYNGGDGGAWDTATANFLNESTPSVFATGDNVTFDSSAEVVLTNAGIVAGALHTTHDSGTVTFSGGLLTADSLNVSGFGAVALENDSLFEITVVAGGILEVRDGGVLTTDSLALSENSEVNILTGGQMLVNGVTVLGDQGTLLNVEESLTLGNVTNDIPSNFFIKDGAGTLFLDDGLGSQTTGPVALWIDEGTVVATGTGGGKQINISGDTTFEGQLVLDGPQLMVHASIIDGSGSILIQSPSTIKSRLNQGAVTLDVPILLESPLTLEAQSGNNQVNCTQPISGESSLVKAGNGIVRLTGFNSYTGDTSITAGTLLLSEAYLTDTAAVSIEGNGQLELEHGLGDTVDTLFINQVQMPAGTYGSPDVTAVTLDNVNDTYFNGTGYLIVTNGPVATDYDNWAAGFSLVGGMMDDDDSDGVSNGDEYAFGLEPTNPASVNAISAPLNASAGTFSFTRRNPARFATGLTYTYAYSTTLDADWTDFTLDAETGELADEGDPTQTVTVTLPPSLLGNDKLFVRVTAQ